MKRFWSSMLSVAMLLTSLAIPVSRWQTPVTAEENAPQGYQAVTADPAKERLADLANLTEAPTTGEYRISSPEGLVKLAQFVGAGSSLEKVSLYQTKDIDLQSVSNFTGIGSANTAFEGSFNGQGYWIKNLQMTSSTAEYLGLFNTVGKNAVLKNVRLQNGQVKVTHSTAKGTGALVGKMLGNATVENVYSTCKVVGSSASFMGGIVGSVSGENVKVRNCTGAGAIGIGGSYYVGGIVGAVDAGTLLIENCRNESSIQNNTAEYLGGILGLTQISVKVTVKNCTNTGKLHGARFVGGILGVSAVKNLADVTVSDCTNEGGITVQNASSNAQYSKCAGGIVGQFVAGTLTNNINKAQIAITGYYGGGIIGYASSVADILNCENQGVVIATNGGFIGGIAGAVKKTSSGILNCNNQNTVTCTSNPNDAGVGGIVGYLEDGKVENCTSNRKIAARGHYLGGIVGYTGGDSVSILSCTNQGEAASNGVNVGGIVGCLNSKTATVKNCQNSGSITSSDASGGIVGYALKSVTVENCENKGEINGSNMSGGILARSDGTLVLRKCTNMAKVWGGGGGLCGEYVKATTTIESSFSVDHETSYLGYQAMETYTENGQTYQNIRLIATVVSLDYAQVGMRVTVADTKGNLIKQKRNFLTKTVYKELMIDNQKVNADEYCPGGYFYVLDLGGIPVNLEDTYTLSVEPFSVLADGTLSNGKKDLYFLAMGDTALGRIPDYDVILSEPVVVFQGAQGDIQWGHYQFPHLYETAGGYIMATWGYGNDDVYGGGGNASIKRQMISEDGGLTWRDATSDAKDQIVKNDFPISSFHSVAGYDEPKLADTSKYPYAVTNGNFRLYFAEDLRGVSDALNKPFTASLYNPATKKYETKTVTVNWPHMPVYAWGAKNTIAPVNYLMAISSGYGFIEKDGALYYCTYTRGFDSSAKTREEAIANPYCYYYSVYVFKSVDGGYTWDYLSQVSVDEELYNSEDFNKSCEGFCEPMMSVMPDGSVAMLMRTGGGAPCYIVRSSDDCASWSKPVLFDGVGVLPQILTLDCGVTLSSYGRPGFFMRTTSDPTGQIWREHIQIPLSPRVVLADLSCYYTNMIVIDDHTALLIYSDFNHPDLDDGEGVRKSILVRRITIQMKE